MLKSLKLPAGMFQRHHHFNVEPSSAAPGLWADLARWACVRLEWTQRSHWLGSVSHYL